MIISLIGAVTLAADAQATQAAHAAGWTLQADPGRCTLERRNAEPPSTLSIQTSPGSDDYRVAIVAPSLRKLAVLAPVTITFAPSQKTLSGRGSVIKLPGDARGLWMEGVAPGVLDGLSGADTMTIAVRSGENVSVKVAGSAKAVEAFRRCSADQLIEWGADSSQFMPGGTTPVALKSRDEWLSRGQLLAAKGQSRRLDIDEVFRVAVSPEGLIENCHSLSDKIEKGFEKTVCDAVVKRPLFAAAKDPAGQSIRGVATFRVRLASRPSL